MFLLGLEGVGRIGTMLANKFGMAKNDYTEDSIKTLEWVPHIRKRPGMYIGEIGDEAELVERVG